MKQFCAYFTFGSYKQIFFNVDVPIKAPNTIQSKSSSKERNEKSLQVESGNGWSILIHILPFLPLFLLCMYD